MGNTARQFFLYELHQLLVGLVAFAYGKEAGLVEQFRVELFEFVEQDFVFLLDVFGVNGYYKQQHRVAFDVT